jgi:DNA-binding FadR family transcriptional regulator
VAAAGLHALEDQLGVAGEVHEAHVALRAVEQVAVGALEGRAGDDGAAAGAGLAAHPVAHGLEPGPAVVVGEGRAGGHLRDVRGRVELVRLREGPAEPLGEGGGDRGLAGSGDPHHHDVAGLCGHADSFVDAGGAVSSAAVRPKVTPLTRLSTPVSGPPTYARRGGQPAAAHPERTMTTRSVPPSAPAGAVPAATVMATRIIEELGRDIVDGTLVEGTRLTIEDLQQRFGVSRTVVRDCVRVLEAMALIVPKRRVGLVVQGPDRWNVYDPRIIRWRLTGSGRSDQFRSLTQLRRAVEPVAASLAARNATAAQRTRIAGLAVDLRRLGEAGALVDFLAVDIEFHHLILEASGNDMFSALREVITEVLSGRTHQGLMPRTPRPHALHTHEQVAHAIRDGDAATAEAGMASLLAEVSSAIS